MSLIFKVIIGLVTAFPAQQQRMMGHFAWWEHRLLTTFHSALWDTLSVLYGGGGGAQDTYLIESLLRWGNSCGRSLIRLEEEVQGSRCRCSRWGALCETTWRSSGCRSTHRVRLRRDAGRKSTYSARLWPPIGQRDWRQRDVASHRRNVKDRILKISPHHHAHWDCRAVGEMPAMFAGDRWVQGPSTGERWTGSWGATGVGGLPAWPQRRSSTAAAQTAAELWSLMETTVPHITSSKTGNYNTTFFSPLKYSIQVGVYLGLTCQLGRTEEVTWECLVGDHCPGQVFQPRQVRQETVECWDSQAAVMVQSQQSQRRQLANCRQNVSGRTGESHFTQAQLSQLMP